MTSQFDDVIINEIKTCDWSTAHDIIKNGHLLDCCQDLKIEMNKYVEIKITFKMDINQNFEWTKS